MQNVAMKVYEKNYNRRKTSVRCVFPYVGVLYPKVFEARNTIQ